MSWRPHEVQMPQRKEGTMVKSALDKFKLYYEDLPVRKPEVKK